LATKDRFDEAATTWDELPRRRELAAAVAAEIERRVPLSGEVDVLDFGCGTGLVTLALQPFVGRVTGADTSAGMLGELQRKVRDRRLANVETLLLDPAAPLPSDRLYDLVVSSMALHHVEDVGALFRRLHGLLRDGGRVALADLDREDGTFHEDARGVFHLGFDRDDIASLLARGHAERGARVPGLPRHRPQGPRTLASRSSAGHPRDAGTRLSED
jgi:SAM-dependent methyltransferase